MGYTALYRKWRPTRFEDVRGQDHIVQTLTNQLTNNRIGHAYLFCGTRGTGKTTVAKIFARAVNCEHPVNGSPCNECETCRQILNGNSVNVVEIDAASNNGVDNIREIREEVKYRPTEGKYRVYIIDEVHMLSAGAFNALLKTLEEPPEYVIFILATTEVHKIPITILSRCQRYDFRRLSLQELENQIRDILTQEGIPVDPRAVTFLARQADGSSRDALSLLEQCISFRPGEALSYEKVLDILGAVDQSVFSEMLRHIMKKDVAAAIAATDNMLATGRDLSQFVTDFTWYLRNIMLIQTENPGEEVLGISRENLELMREEAMNMDISEVMRYIRILSELSNEMHFSTSKRIQFELAMIKMMRSEMEETPEALLDRIRFLEERVAALSGGEIPVTNTETITAPAQAPLREVPEVQVSPALYEDYEMLARDWKDIVLNMNTLVRSLFNGTQVSADEHDRIVILFRDAFKQGMVEEGSRDRELKEVLKEKYGKEFSIVIKGQDPVEAAPKITRKAMFSGINMEVEET